MKIVSSLDLLKNELKNARVHILASPPASPVQGQIYFDTTLVTLREYDGSNWQSLATQAYVDAIAQGLDFKPSVRAASAGSNLTLSGTQTVDGVSLIAGDRILVKDQSAGAANGIYVVAAGTWARGTDADVSSEVTGGMFVFVEEGTVNSDSSWVLSNDGAITLGTTVLTFVQFSGAGQIIAGAGLTKTGNTLDVGGTASRITVGADTVDIAATYVGQTSLTTLGTISTGTWQGTQIGIAYGGTNATTAAGARSNLGTTGKFSSTVGNGSLLTFAINHALGSTDVEVSVKDTSTLEIVLADYVVTDANNVQVSFGTAPSTNQYRITIVA